MIKAIIISNGTDGLKNYFVSNDKAQYDFVEIDEHFDPELNAYDLLIVPNGSDHIAMFKIKEKVAKFLDQGKALFCFDGWFTSWIPKNQWVMSNEKKTIDTRYNIKTDRYGIFNNIDLNKLTFQHNISGWWACGYIEASAHADVIIEDTWKRPIIVLDEKTTNGIIIMTASGPLGDSGPILEKDETSSTLAMLYQNMLDLIIKKKAYENNRISV